MEWQQWIGKVSYGQVMLVKVSHGGAVLARSCVDRHGSVSSGSAVLDRICMVGYAPEGKGPERHGSLGGER